jgi:hypothetical protein
MSPSILGMWLAASAMLAAPSIKARTKPLTRGTAVSSILLSRQAGSGACGRISSHAEYEERPVFASRTPNTETVVKALQWQDTSGQDEDGGYDVIGASADHPLAHYWITYADMRRDEIWLVMRDRGVVIGHYMTMAEAKAAAQADFDQRIRSALASPPSPAEVTEPEPVAWQWSDFSGNWYTVDTNLSRMSLSAQEGIAIASAATHAGRVRPLFASPPAQEAVTDDVGRILIEDFVQALDHLKKG